MTSPTAPPTIAPIFNLDPVVVWVFEIPVAVTETGEVKVRPPDVKVIIDVDAVNVAVGASVVAPITAPLVVVVAAACAGPVIGKPADSQYPIHTAKAVDISALSLHWLVTQALMKELPSGIMLELQ